MGDVRQEMNRLHDEMNRLFSRWGGNGTHGYARSTYPALNLWEDDGNLYVEAELPGFSLDNLEIYVTGENQLSLKGERKQPEMEGGTWHRQERGFGSFARLIELPTAVDSDKVAANFEQGVLTIALPKREEVKPRRIEVKTS
jgi:HSP20 family protein